MNKIVSVKKIYTSGYSKTIRLKNNLRVIEVLSLLNCFIPKNPERMLDVGCGGGLISKEIAKKGFQVYGVDFSSEAIKFAQSQNPEINFQRPHQFPKLL